MSTTVFGEKLDTLPATLELFRRYDASLLANGIAQGARRHVLSIGSGGSAIAAEYFARCRDTLGLGPTTVQTPMQAVLDQCDLTESDVWLFSAGADNPDATAASRAALDRKARSIHLVTRNPDGAAAGIIERGGGHIHAVPVAELKDGYLATHSLLSSVVALLLACDAASRDPRGTIKLLDALASRLTNMRDAAAKTRLTAAISHLQRADTVVVACDPLLRPTAVLFDTSIWEASLCHVQTTDFRNLAHGRHAWLHHRMDETFILALTGIDSRATWAAMETLLPQSLHRFTFDFGFCGRLDNALSLIDGMGMLEAMGDVLGIDPAKPGIGEFGRSVYDDRSLDDLANALPANVRHKRAAIAKSDSHDPTDDPLDIIGRARLEALSKTEVGGAVFDYDGTIVTTLGRWSVPDQAIVNELVRLHRAGLAIGFATGRGGSAGEDLRKVLPAEMLPLIPIGYYNGGHLRTANVDINNDHPMADPAITETAEWLRQHAELFLQHEFKHSEVQITVDMDRLRHPYRFSLDMEACPPFANAQVRVSGSGHSYDIIPVTSSKLVVVEALRSRLAASAEVLCFGDSGSRPGNDYALLSHELGISVGEVCGTANGCWSLFGVSPIGPDALLRILRALIPSENGKIRFDIVSLGLDKR
ncbi:HAD hydrolase family protein [Rhizobium lentis]|uniref:HAD hydrolase family protein n=1 Tax=Rhizobium lentis TaxID=1138194 RepID=UPI001C8344A4|nr:HAD hydrolase family protein [Rhizobium lentis]MBX5012219.1 HAD hydrolase family protein [Rhizobium lentis]